MTYKTHGEASDYIVNQMLKGVKGTYPESYQGRKNEERRAKLCELLRPYISLFVPYIPSRCNAAIGAVICKCAVKYGLAKALAFAKAVNEGKFNGYNDPAHLLWLYLVRNNNLRSRVLYAVTVTAAAYCEGRELQSIRESGTDICDWIDELIPMLQDMSGQLVHEKSNETREKFFVE